jgi:hypothetical protein
VCRVDRRGAALTRGEAGLSLTRHAELGARGRSRKGAGGPRRSALERPAKRRSALERVTGAVPGGNWGSTAAEREAQLPCDELLVATALRLHRAVSIDAPPALVFRWLCQLKLAPYSYDLIDNLGRRSPRALVAGTERLEVGQRFMTIFRLVSFRSDEHITLSTRRVAVTYAVRAEGTGSRLVARVIYEPPGPRLRAVVQGWGLALGDIVMMRKQLLTLKRLAERDAHGSLAP